MENKYFRITIALFMLGIAAIAVIQYYSLFLITSDLIVETSTIDYTKEGDIIKKLINVNVYIDVENIVRSNEFIKIKTGNHLIRCETYNNNYTTPDKKIFFVDGGDVNRIEFLYEPNYGFIDISTFDDENNPIKAKIYSDGVKIGVEKSFQQFKNGIYNISFGNIPGYIKPKSLNVSVDNGVFYSYKATYERILPKRMDLLIVYNSNRTAGIFTADYFKRIFNISIPVETFDIFDTNKTYGFYNHSVVWLDQSVKDYDFNSTQINEIWSAINEGTSFIFTDVNSRLYYRYFDLNYKTIFTNYLSLVQNHDILAPSHLAKQGSTYNLTQYAYPFESTFNQLPSSHEALFQNEDSPDGFNYPTIIFGHLGKGKIITYGGNVGDLENVNGFNVPWVISRIMYWLLPTHQPLRNYQSKLSISFRYDNTGGGWAGNLDNQLNNISLVQSWDVPITWVLTPEFWSNSIWGERTYINKLISLESSGHKIFLGGGGFYDTWSTYSTSKARKIINDLIASYESILNHRPEGWVTPQSGYSENIVNALAGVGIRYDSEDRVPGTVLNKEGVFDVSCIFYRGGFEYYKNSIDRAWLFGPRTITIIISPSIINNYNMDEWFYDLKAFLNYYPCEWLTLDKVADSLYAQPYVKVQDMIYYNDTIDVTIFSKFNTRFYLELKNSTFNQAFINDMQILPISGKSVTQNIVNDTKIKLITIQ